MLLTLVHFDRIFDVVHGARGYQDTVTQFSFEYAGKRHLCVTVCGQEEVSSGMKVIALLKRNDDWLTLQGWISCSMDVLCTDSIVGLHLQIYLRLCFLPLFCFFFGSARFPVNGLFWRY